MVLLEFGGGGHTVPRNAGVGLWKKLAYPHRGKVPWPPVNCVPSARPERSMIKQNTFLHIHHLKGKNFFPLGLYAFLPKQLNPQPRHHPSQLLMSFSPCARSLWRSLSGALSLALSLAVSLLALSRSLAPSRGLCRAVSRGLWRPVARKRRLACSLGTSSPRNASTP